LSCVNVAEDKPEASAAASTSRCSFAIQVGCWPQNTEQRISYNRIRPQHPEHPDKLDRAEDIRDPEVVLFVLQRFEVFSETQRSNDIEGGEIESTNHVYGFAFPRSLTYLADKRVNIGLHSSFLLLDGVMGHAMAEEPSNARMIRIGCARNIRDTVGLWRVDVWVFGERSVDIFPCFRVRE
jgi:hypothetical protein